MKFSLIEILTAIGSLGFFMFGMKIMSEAIQKIAGTRIRSTIESLSSSRARGIFSGFAITSLIQSSSATTVLVVGFVNAGLLTLSESLGIIMGANIGTTITAWLITIVGFKINITAFTLPLIGLGFPMTFSGKDNIKFWGEFIIGFSLLFMGLNEIKNVIPDLSQYPEVFTFLSNYTDYGLVSVILFLILGTILTMVAQSSSATMAFTLVLANEGWLPFELAASMVLGANVGTTITANIAALIGNVYAKRAAFSHFLFNFLGAIWVIIFLPVFLQIIDFVMQGIYGLSPMDASQPQSIPVGLSIFHTSFNLVNTLILVWTIPWMIKIATRLIPGKKDEKFKLEYIGGQMVAISDIQIAEARKEILISNDILNKMSDLLKEMISNPRTKYWQEHLSKIKKYEEITNRIEREISKFLMRLSKANISNKASMEIQAIHRINIDLENIGNLYYKMSSLIQRSKETSAYFTKEQTDSLLELFSLLEQAQQIMKSNLVSENGEFDFESAFRKEIEIDAKRNEMRREYLKNLENGKYSIESAMFYNDLFVSCEEVGDHMFSVSVAMRED